MTVFLAQRSLYPCLPTLKGIITLINIFNPFERDSHLRVTVNVALKSGLYSEITQGCRIVSATLDTFEEYCSGSRGVVLCHGLPQPLQAVPLTSKDAPPTLSSGSEEISSPTTILLLRDDHLGKVIGHRSRQFKILMTGHCLLNLLFFFKKTAS